MDTVTYDDNDYHFRIVKMTSQPYSENSYNGLNPYRKRFLDSLYKPHYPRGVDLGFLEDHPMSRLGRL